MTTSPLKQAASGCNNPLMKNHSIPLSIPNKSHLATKTSAHFSFQVAAKSTTHPHIIPQVFQYQSASCASKSWTFHFGWFGICHTHHYDDKDKNVFVCEFRAQTWTHFELSSKTEIAFVINEEKAGKVFEGAFVGSLKRELEGLIWKKSGILSLKCGRTSYSTPRYRYSRHLHLFRQF